MLGRRIKEGLNRQRESGRYRTPLKIRNRTGKYLLTDHGPLLNLASNDYLGLSVSPVLQQKVAQNFKKYGSSASSSRLVSANFTTMAEAERTYAEYFGFEAALLFPSGFQANIGVLSALFEQGDTLVVDKHVHASTVKGIQLSRAGFTGYNHNDLHHLEKRLKKAVPAAVISESLFSMDGDLLEISAFSALKARYGFFSLIDEAHALGTFGRKGLTVAGNAADIAVCPLGKAMGLFGAMVLLPAELREYLINFSSPQIYTTSLPEAHAASCLDALALMEKADDARTRLRQVSAFAQNHLKQHGFRIKGDAHILAIEIGSEAEAAALSNRLMKKGFFLFPARFPTVPKGKAILRLSLTALHDDTDIRNLRTALEETL